MRALALSFLGLLGAPSATHACALVGGAEIRIQGEEALIVWDPATKTEHFIRRAAWKGAPKDFGFLVPTPARPSLAEADTAVFDRLFELYKEPVMRSRARAVATNDAPQAKAAVAPVRVIEQKTVAGLDATVLLATDTKALLAWLSAHEYPSNPALTAWLSPYLAQGAYITAFKISAQPGGVAGSGAVRMSFSVDAPFYPYAEPRGGKAPPRPFRVSLIAPTKMTARLGGSRWSAKVGYAAPLESTSRAEVLSGVVPAEARTGAAWLTVFDEPASLRGRDDLRFLPAGDEQRVGSAIRARILP